MVGLISNLRSYLWIPIAQNSYRYYGVQDVILCVSVRVCEWVGGGWVGSTKNRWTKPEGHPAPWFRFVIWVGILQARLPGRLHPRPQHGAQLPPHPKNQYCSMKVLQSTHVLAGRRASLDVFTHTLNMDLNFHLHRKTGELMRIMDRGECFICIFVFGHMLHSIHFT